MENNGFETANINFTSQQVNGTATEENLLNIVLEHRWIILSIVVLFLLMAFMYLIKALPIYTGASRVYVEQSGPKIISDYEGIMTRSKNYLFTQSELIRSTPILASVADKPQIRQLKTFNNVDNITGFVKKNLSVDIGKKDDIITIAFDSPYSAEAAQVVNEVVNAYIDYHATQKRSTVSEVLKILQKEKVKRDAELSEKFAQMLEFTRQNGVVSSDKEGGHVIFQKLSKLSEALTETQLAVINAKAELEAVRNMMSEPAKVKQFVASLSTASVRVLMSDVETKLREELTEAERQLKTARNFCTENHPSIKALQGKIEHIKQQLNNEAKEFAKAYLDVAQIRWATAKERENELESSYDGQCRAAQELGIKAAEYSILQSELKRTERLCEILDNRIKELNVTEDTGALNITILEVAHPPDKPSKPKKARVMAIALFLGLFCGCGFAVLRDLLDYRLQSTEEVATILGVPVLGIVPAMEQELVADKKQKILKTLGDLSQKFRQLVADNAPSFSRTFKTHADVAVKTVPLLTVEQKAAITKRGQIVFLKPRSTIAEAYRTIRTAVFFGVPKGQAKTILVTSPAPGDGKSTLASNLAVAMAQAGQKVLLLDADLRKPMQHNIFQLDKEKGITAVLAETLTLQQAIQTGPVPGLDVLPCGPDIPNPSEVLNGTQFTTQLKGLTQRYDRVIIDSPPVAPVADSHILAAICDVTLIVLRAEKSTRKHSQQAGESLRSVGGRLLGAIINDVPRKRSHYGYYSKYGAYGYGRYGHYGHYGLSGHEEKQSEQKVCV